MKVISPLVHRLERTQSETGVKVLAWTLETLTGIKTNLLMKSQTIGSFNTVTAENWYKDNGYRGISRWLGLGTASHSGISITQDNALESSAVYAGTKIISEDMGSMPFNLYRRSTDRRWVNEAYDHPLWTTLRNIWNPEISGGEGVEALTANAILTGNGYASIERGPFGVRLWPWDPDSVRTDHDGKGRLYFLHRESAGVEKTYSLRDVLILKGFTLNGKLGDPMLVRARHVLGLTLATQEYAGRYFANDATPGIVIQYPLATASGGIAHSAEAVQNIKEAWSKWHRGLSRSHEPAVLQYGAEVKTITHNAQESQLLEQRQFQILEVCRLLRLSPHKLADLTKSSYSNNEQAQIEYISNTLNVWLERWKRAVWRCLLTVDEQQADELYAEHDMRVFLRGDFATQAEGWRKLLEKGVYSIDDIRGWLRMNPLPNGAGSNHFIQLNLGTVQDVASGATLASNAVGNLPASGVTP